MWSRSGSLSGRSSSACSSTSDCQNNSFDAADELLQIGSRRIQVFQSPTPGSFIYTYMLMMKPTKLSFGLWMWQLRIEKDMLKESQPHSIELVRVLFFFLFFLFSVINILRVFVILIGWVLGHIWSCLYPQRLELHTKSLSKSRLEDTARIRTMEKDLLNCYKEIGRNSLFDPISLVSLLN